MKLKFFAVLTLLSVSFLFTGCYSTVDGRTKAGSPISKDKITSRYERSVDQVIAAAREVLKRNGQIVSDDSVTHSLSAKVNRRNVFVIVSKIDEKVSEVKVQVRSSGFGDINLASDLSTQIGIQLAVSQ
jgi:hypothetical protein